jgi:predicted TIM-barrel fold metal-dependent hydrolase
MAIDAHAHVGQGRYKQLAPEDLLRQMDAHGIDRAVICPVEEYITVGNREGNDFILEQVRQYPDRFLGFAVANPWHGEEAVAELRRALGEGLRGLKLHPVIQGFHVNDALVEPLLDVAAEFGVPVYSHSGTPHYGEPFKLCEAARRYPDVTFILGHGGASDFWNDIPRACTFASNLLLETSRNGPSNFLFWKNHIGVDRIVFGSNAPESQYPLEIASLRDVFDEAELAQVLGGNMARVLGLSGEWVSG